MSSTIFQDYMSIELENGNVVFKYDLGAGVAKISHPHYVSDNKWYKVTAKRWVVSEKCNVFK